MDVISFKIEDEDVADKRSPVVNIYVNGRKLQDLAFAVELPFAKAEGSPDLAGDYAGLPPDVIAPGSRHFLGQPLIKVFSDGDTVLLGCTCGEVECWPLTAQVDITETIVSWAGFRTGHREWDLAALGPFTFAREQYETAMLDA